MTDPLIQRSVAVLRGGQARSGAFVASPSYPTYGYAWLRDGSFCVHALEVLGQRAAAAAFHNWAADSIEAHRALFESAIAQPDPDRMPPARYTLDGARESPDGDEPWPNFQIDGYGMWLWALERHLRGRGVGELAPTVRLVGDYLASSWQLKCFNCWEEFEDGEHASTLAAAAAGLSAAARLLDLGMYAEAADAVVARLRDRFVVDGRLRRGPADDRLDGSLAWTVVPFGVFDPSDPVVPATTAALAAELCGPGGGVYRYRGDTFYGGGQWLLLTSSLAWHERVVGNEDVACALQAWVRTQALPNGDLTEQTTAHV